MDARKGTVLKVCVLTAMLTGLPLIGIVLAGKDVGKFLQFPPTTERYVDIPAFSWGVFLFHSVYVLAIIIPFIFRILSYRQTPSSSILHSSFPRWGFVGILLGIASWVLAWNRFEWFAPLQRHTFTPLWISYILTINAFTFWRTGECLMTRRPKFFAILFLISAGFWWFFEYLNRFVQNWYYVNIGDFNALEYSVFATFSFSTVLPAVLSTQEFLKSFAAFNEPLRSFAAVRISPPKHFPMIVLLFAGLGLAGIGIYPNLLYPLLWVSPVLIITSVQALIDEKNIFTKTFEGDWRTIWTFACAAVMCGIFWEMWNYYSYAKWIYTIPYAHRFQIFEMPALGFAGYLPFGLECAVISDQLERLKIDGRNEIVPEPEKIAA